MSRKRKDENIEVQETQEGTTLNNDELIDILC